MALEYKLKLSNYINRPLLALTRFFGYDKHQSLKSTDQANPRSQHNPLSEQRDIVSTGSSFQAHNTVKLSKFDKAMRKSAEIQPEQSDIVNEVVSSSRIPLTEEKPLPNHSSSLSQQKTQMGANERAEISHQKTYIPVDEEVKISQQSAGIISQKTHISIGEKAEISHQKTYIPVDEEVKISQQRAEVSSQKTHISIDEKVEISKQKTYIPVDEEVKISQQGAGISSQKTHISIDEKVEISKQKTYIPVGGKT